MAAEIPGSKDVAPPASKGFGGLDLETVKAVLPAVIAGSLRGATVDLLGLPVELVNETLGAVGLKSKEPVGGIDFVRKAFGQKSMSQDTPAEVGGSFISPGGAAKAMIVGALPRLKQLGYAAEQQRDILRALNQIPEDMQGVSKSYMESTGVFRGVEGKPKAALSDRESFIDRTRVVKNIAPEEGKMHTVLAQDTTLGKLLGHEKLYEMYPELRNIRVVHNPDINVDGAVYKAKTSTIEIGPQSSDARFHSAILHEVQHAVQAVEDFAYGSTARAHSTKGYYDKELISRLQERRDAGDQKAKDMLKIINEKRQLAYEKYMATPGEAEARFTEATRMYNQSQLETEIARIIEDPKPVSFWDK